MAQPTLQLRRLGLNNFRGFVGAHSIDLPENGLVMVLGQNQDTEGSSGSGKSSFVEAPPYALGCSEFSGTDLQSWSWLTEDPLSVELDFTTPKGEAYLKRGKVTTLRVGSNPAVKGKTVAEELQKLLGVRPELLKALTYRPQKKPGLFLDMTDSEKKEFLTELLGIGQFEVESDRVTKLITSMEREYEVQERLVQEARGRLGQQPEEPAEPDTSAEERDVAALKTKVDQFDAAVKQMRELIAEYGRRLDERVAQVDRVFQAPLANAYDARREAEVTPSPLPERPEALTALEGRLATIRRAIKQAKDDHAKKLLDARAGLKAHQTLLRDLQVRAASGAAAKRDLDRLTAELTSLEAKKCAMCQRPWEDETYHVKVQELTRKRGNAQLSVNAAEVAARDSSLQQMEVEAFQTKVSELEAQDPVPQKLRDAETQHVQAVAKLQEQHNNAERVAMAEYRQKVAEAQAALDQVKRQRAEAMEAAQTMNEEHTAALLKLGKLTEAGNLVRLQHSEATTRLNSVRYSAEQDRRQYQFLHEQWLKREHEVMKLEDKLVNLGRDLDEQRDWLGFVKGFLALIFDETLARVATLTNERLARIPNVQGLTLRFTSEHQTKTSGNLRQEIRAVVEKDGHVIPLKAGVSGGMYSAVELAVDLSLADVIAERTGVLPGWLILDEAFDGLDLPSKKACMEMLKEVATDRLILVIDHATELKEFFDASIRVVSRDGRSSFA